MNHVTHKKTLLCSLMTITLLLSLIVQAEEASPKIERTKIGEWLRASDIEPRQWAVKALFKQGGILNYQTLKLLWVSEPSSKIRNQIAINFKQCGECRYLSGDVVAYWRTSLKRFNLEERATREKELADVFGT